jgi:hypothetical protein
MKAFTHIFEDPAEIKEPPELKIPGGLKFVRFQVKLRYQIITSYLNIIGLESVGSVGGRLQLH